MTARSSTQDPLKNFRFRIIIPGLADETSVARFTRCTGLSVTAKVDVIRGGGQNDYPEKSAGMPEVSDITLTRGYVVDPDGKISSSLALWNWWQQVANGNTFAHNDREYRRDITVQYLYRDGTVAQTWMYQNAFPVGFKLSDKEGVTTSGNAMEELVITYERPVNPDAVPAPTIGGTNNPILNV